MNWRSGSLGLALLIATNACATEWFDLVSDRRPEAGIPTIDAAVDSGTSGLRDASTPPPPDTGMSMPDSGPFVPVARCGAVACACDDGLDNDGDTLIDGFDPECTGALDENEATFATGKPSKVKACRDCFWDEGMGTGNDVCRYPSECLRGVAPRGAGNCSSCLVGQGCLDMCETRTPNGCDCFGCCEVRSPSGETVTIELTDTCSIDEIGDPQACPVCLPSTQCWNPCERCELCPGRTARDLPADCHVDPAPSRCDPGVTVCADSADCSTDHYCQLGCCFRLLL